MRPRDWWLLKALQYALGLAALGWVIVKQDWHRIETSLAFISPTIVLALLTVTVVGLLARFATWHVLVNRIQPSDYSASARTDLAVNFVNQLLPSRLSGRSVAPLVVRQFTELEWSGAVAVTGVHTGVYALFYAIVALIGLTAGLGRFSSAVSVLIGLSTVLYLVAGIITLSGGVHMDVLYQLGSRAPIPAVLPDRLSTLATAMPSFTEESSMVFRNLLSGRTIGLYAAGWVVATAIVPSVRVWLLISGMGSSFAPAALLPFYLVAAYSVTLLPITPGGIGITEATATLAFVSLGVPGSIAFSVILLDRFLGVYIPALAGGYPALRVDLSNFTTS